MEYIVVIYDIETGEPIKRFDPCRTLLGATRLEDAIIDKTDFG